MLTRFRDIDEEALSAVRDDERPWAALVHALGWIPIWGWLFNTVMQLHYKNRSREIVFHVQQAIQMQIVVLLVLAAWCGVTILSRILTVLSPTVGDLMQTGGDFVMAFCLTGLALVSIYGAVVVYTGRPFLYPVIGRRVLEGSIRKYTEE